MRLYLVQHGEATSKDENPERPLSEVGIAHATQVAAFAARHLTVNITQIFHSGKTRACQTAEIFAEHLNPVNGIVATDGLAPNDDPIGWLARVGETTGDLMLVGHLPHLARLCGLLLCGGADKTAVRFRNAGIVCLERGDDGDWGLAGMITPKCLK